MCLGRGGGGVLPQGGTNLKGGGGVYLKGGSNPSIYGTFVESDNKKYCISCTLESQ